MIREFKYKIRLKNNKLTINVKPNMVLTIDKSNNIYITYNNNTSTIEYTNNTIITSIVITSKQYSILIDLFKDGLLDWFEYCNVSTIKLADNVKTVRDNGTFLYIGNINASYKRITDTYYSIEQLEKAHNMKLRNVSKSSKKRVRKDLKKHG